MWKLNTEHDLRIKPLQILTKEGIYFVLNQALSSGLKARRLADGHVWNQKEKYKKYLAWTDGSVEVKYCLVFQNGDFKMCQSALPAD